MEEKTAYEQEQEWRANVRDYFSAMRAHFQWWIGVTVASAWAAIYQGVGGTIPPGIFWFLAILGLFVASFLTWRDERLKARRAILDARATFRSENERMLRELEDAQRAHAALRSEVEAKPLSPVELRDAIDTLVNEGEGIREKWYAGDLAQIENHRVWSAKVSALSKKIPKVQWRDRLDEFTVLGAAEAFDLRLGSPQAIQDSPQAIEGLQSLMLMLGKLRSLRFDILD